jgi:hypothetical protein
MLIIFCNFFTKSVDSNDNTMIKLPGPKMEATQSDTVMGITFASRLMKTTLHIYFNVNTKARNKIKGFNIWVINSIVEYTKHKSCSAIQQTLRVENINTRQKYNIYQRKQFMKC